MPANDVDPIRRLPFEVWMMIIGLLNLFPPPRWALAQTMHNIGDTSRNERHLFYRQASPSTRSIALVPSSARLAGLLTTRLVYQGLDEVLAARTDLLHFMLTCKMFAEMVPKHLYECVVITSGRELGSLARVLGKTVDSPAKYIRELYCLADLTDRTVIGEWYTYSRDFLDPRLLRIADEHQSISFVLSSILRRTDVRRLFALNLPSTNPVAPLSSHSWHRVTELVMPLRSLKPMYIENLSMMSHLQTLDLGVQYIHHAFLLMNVSFPTVKHLKIRQADTTDQAIAKLLCMFPNLESLLMHTRYLNYKRPRSLIPEPALGYVLASLDSLVSLDMQVWRRWQLTSHEQDLCPNVRLTNLHELTRLTHLAIDMPRLFGINYGLKGAEPPVPAFPTLPPMLETLLIQAGKRMDGVEVKPVFRITALLALQSLEKAFRNDELPKTLTRVNFPVVESVGHSAWEFLEEVAELQTAFAKRGMKLDTEVDSE